MSVKSIVVCDYCNAEIVNSLAFTVISNSNSFSLTGFSSDERRHVHNYCAELELKSWLFKSAERKLSNDLQN